jgi:hypothetical protein
MATFKVQVEDITGSVGDDTAISSWLQDGAKEVVNFIPQPRLEQVASTAVFENTIDVEGKKVLGVLRKDAGNSNLLTPCVKVESTKKGVVQDSSNMEYATTGDPVYWFDGDTLQVFPTSASSNDMSLVHISLDFSAVTYDDSSITNFPDEAEPAVVLYATRNALQRLMTDTISNSDITTALTAVNAEFDKSDALLDLGENDTEGDVNTALTAINTELDELQSIADNVHSEVQLVNAQADSALTEIIAANAEVDKMAAETGLDNAELDLAKVELAEAAVIVDATVDAVLANINQAADKCAAAVALANTQFDSAVTANAAEDIELAGSHVNAGSGFIGEANAGLTEAQSYTQEAQAALSQVQNQVNVAQGYIQNGAGYSRVADGYAKAAQGFLGTASGYLSAGQGFSASAAGYASEIQAKLGIASGYGNEVSARLAQAQAKRDESQSRLAAGNAYLQEATGRASEVNSYGTEVQQRLAQVGAQGNVAASYIAAAQGYAGEIQAKIGIASGYLQEMQGRLAVDTSKYSWYEKQYAMVDARYKEFIQSLIGGTK